MSARGIPFEPLLWFIYHYFLKQALRLKCTGMKISVSVLTYNEELNLPACLQSVDGCDDIVIYDSHSTDDTCKIAYEYGARVFQRKFDNYAAQRNAALSEVEYKYPWLLMLDADERVTPELFSELGQRVRPESKASLFKVRRKDMFMGRWLRRSSGYPTWLGRVMRPGYVRVEREINEEYHTNGEVRYLKEHLVHYPFYRGVAYWYERHNRYSSMEARALIEESTCPLSLRDLSASDPGARRRALKQLAYRLPGRPFLVFCYLYFARMGFLDGRPGMTFCALRSVYEHMIDVKARELRRRASGHTV